jgi:hypothetical protein
MLQFSKFIQKDLQIIADHQAAQHLAVKAKAALKTGSSLTIKSSISCRNLLNHQNLN